MCEGSAGRRSTDTRKAIDLMTRRLLAAGQRPVTVGFFFSLGHSTVVIITSLVVAATSAAVSSKFDDFSRVGGIIGTSVAAVFLLLLGLMNSFILVRLVQEMRRALSQQRQDEHIFELQGAGCLLRLLQGAFKFIDRPWKMYPLGFLFGLGFDTSSEVALLGLASIQGKHSFLHVGEDAAFQIAGFMPAASFMRNESIFVCTSEVFLQTISSSDPIGVEIAAF